MKQIAEFIVWSEKLINRDTFNYLVVASAVIGLATMIAVVSGASIKLISFLSWSGVSVLTLSLVTLGLYATGSVLFRWITRRQMRQEQSIRET